MQMTGKDIGPWYREPWPWLLMAGPAAVVVAGFATLWLAVSSNDGLVADDYYKQGLAINQTLQREALTRGMAINVLGHHQHGLRLSCNLLLLPVQDLLRDGGDALGGF